MNIEKNIPLSKVQREQRPHRASIYPFADMEVGDSFLAPAEGRDECRAEQARLVAASRYFVKTRNPNAQFKSRSVAGGVRVWRTA